MAELTTFEQLKIALLELKDGYPDHIFWGKIEYRDIKAINLLVNHKIIEKITEEELDMMTPEQLEKMPPKRKDRLNSYRLTSKGVDLAISMINLEHSEKILKHSKIMKKLTYWIIILSVLTLYFGIVQFLLK